MPIAWTADLNTGIDLIDSQHRQILDHINQLEAAHSAGERDHVRSVLNELLEYTISHFAFEESLQEDAGYAFAKPHKKVHELFSKRAKEYIARFERGEDVTLELHSMLLSWLINHIKRDDADYVSAVKQNMQEIISERDRSKGRSWLKRFFTRAQ